MDKKTFKVNIRETLERVVEVEASDDSEAIRKVKEQYYTGDIVLTSEDYVDTELSIFEGSE